MHVNCCCGVLTDVFKSEMCGHIEYSGTELRFLLNARRTSVVC